MFKKFVFPVGLLAAGGIAVALTVGSVDSSAVAARGAGSGANPCAPAQVNPCAPPPSNPCAPTR